MKTRNLHKQTFQIRESNCTIITDKKSGIKKATSSIRHHRSQLQDYIKTHKKFLYSLDPLLVIDGPRVVNLMAEVAVKANVGPMAAVAGVIADLAVEEMINNGCKVAVIENGGEISAVSNQPIDVALSAGDVPLSREMGFRLEQFPIGVATSSGLFSHALSFGDAEAVTIFAANAGIADAAATAVANVIKGDDTRGIIEMGINKGLKIEDVNGVLILYNGIVGKGGQIPELIKVKSKK